MLCNEEVRFAAGSEYVSVGPEASRKVDGLLKGRKERRNGREDERREVGPAGLADSVLRQQHSRKRCVSIARACLCVRL